MQCTKVLKWSSIFLPFSILEVVEYMLQSFSACSVFGPSQVALSIQHERNVNNIGIMQM